MTTHATYALATINFRMTGDHGDRVDGTHPGTDPAGDAFFTIQIRAKGCYLVQKAFERRRHPVHQRGGFVNILAKDRFPCCSFQRDLVLVCGAYAPTHGDLQERNASGIGVSHHVSCHHVHCQGVFSHKNPSQKFGFSVTGAIALHGLHGVQNGKNRRANGGEVHDGVEQMARIAGRMRSFSGGRVGDAEEVLETGGNFGLHMGLEFGHIDDCGSRKEFCGDLGL